MVAKQLLEHINANNLDNPYQSAYKAGHSTETALLYIKNEVHLSLSRGESTALVLLDLSAAFDTIDHSTLLGCLQNWFEGPRWQSGNTLASHLCGRGSIPVMAVSGKAGSCLPLVGSLQYTTLANYMYWFPLPFQLPVVI